MGKPSKRHQKMMLLIEKINTAYRIGDTVKVKQDNDQILDWTIKAEASILGGHTPVIWVNEQSSCYKADRLIFPADQVVVKVDMEDKGQDLLWFNVLFYPDFQYGRIVSAGPFHDEMYKDQIVLSGKPVEGEHMTISKSPGSGTQTMYYKNEKVTIYK